MSLIAWSDQYATGYKAIDAQHQEFFRRLNALHDALEEPSDKDIVPSESTSDEEASEDAAPQPAKDEAPAVKPEAPANDNAPGVAPQRKVG